MIYVQISFLTDLDRPCYNLCSVRNLCLPYIRGDRRKKIVSPFSKHFLKQSLKVLAVSNPKQLFFILKIVQRQYLTLACDLILVHGKTIFFGKIVLYHQPVLFEMHLLKILNTIFCTAQVLPNCVKSCLRPQHNYSDIDGIVLSIRKKTDWFLHGISLDDFHNNVMFFLSVRPIIYFLLQPFLLTSIPLFMFCLIATCDMHCKQHKPST